ncbi:DUF6844 domain-containing protein [Orrella daihaiensis]|uniref:DUF6844 domain-containing protein n=1 Tax=Orrella daihaiensis TaxID=2782176 RepID=A0ABY4AKU5_9BURK|nr:hypothetical protein [Orrella daihaiensis]UOD50030.1 hypothetical protein DHf2319_11400 [Orrella daihaiensis]
MQRRIKQPTKHLMPFMQTGLALAILLTAQSAVWAQTTPAAPAQCTDTRTATDIVRAELDTWRDSALGQALEARSERGEIVLAVSDPIMVMSQATSSDFGKSRVFAYDKALLNAQAKFIKERQTRTETELATSRFDSAPAMDQMQLQEQEREGRLMRIGDKLFALTEAKLDNALREEGVDVNTIENTEPSKKLDIYRERVGRKSVTTAMGQIAGMMPIENIEALDCNGTAAVATIAVYSDKMRQFAQDVAAGKPIVADPAKASGKTLNATIREEIRVGDIPFIAGLRVVNDQDGFPSLVSYGQWAFVPAGTTPQARERAKQTALNFAEDAARSQIALYLKGSMSLMDSSSIDEQSSEVATITRSDVTTEQVSEIIEQQLRTASAKATITITGVREIGQWVLDHPDLPGVQMVGKVLAWSPQYADAIRSATGDSKRQAINPVAQPQPPQNPSDTTVRKSKSKNNAADF